MTVRVETYRPGLALSIGSAAGVRFGDLPPGFERRVARWLATGGVREGEVIKPGRVYRFEQWIVKIYAPGRALKDRLRAPPALRVARLYERLLPIATPRPLLAIAEGQGPNAGRSVLVMERIDGSFLHDVLRAGDRAAIDAFPRFIAGMHARGVFHGDPHMGQMLWDGSRWVQIDLDGLRHPLRTLWRPRLIENLWAQLEYRLFGDGDLRPVFVRYLELAGLPWEPERAWRRVLARAERVRARKAADGRVGGGRA